MTLPKSRILKDQAADALNKTGDLPRKLVLIHTGAVIVLTLFLFLINYLLDHGISNAGGISGIGTRSILETIQFVLLLLQMIFVPFWQVSWTYIMLRLARGETAQLRDLGMGFRKFFPFLRLKLLTGLIYAGAIFAGTYAGTFVMMITPMGQPLQEIMMSTTDTEVMAEEIYIAINNLMLPMLLISGLFSLLICFPFFYRFRQAEYFLMENTDLGARTAMRASRRLMRGNYLHMLRLDLSFWWFWLFEGLIMLVAYADILLPALGIVLPIPEELIMISTYVLYGLCQILLYYLCKAKVDATYVKAYDALTPPPQPPIQTVSPSL